MAAKMATMFGDVTGLHHPYNIPHLVKKIKGLPLKVKSIRITATYLKNAGEGFHQAPSDLYNGVCVYVRELSFM